MNATEGRTEGGTEPPTQKRKEENNRKKRKSEVLAILLHSTILGFTYSQQSSNADTRLQ